MDDLIAAILGYFSSKYNEKKLSKLQLSLTSGAIFFCGHLIVEIFYFLPKEEKFNFNYFADLIKDLILFSLSFFLIVYIFLCCINTFEQWRKNKSSQ